MVSIQSLDATSKGTDNINKIVLPGDSEWTQASIKREKEYLACDFTACAIGNRKTGNTEYYRIFSKGLAIDIPNDIIEKIRKEKSAPVPKISEPKLDENGNFIRTKRYQKTYTRRVIWCTPIEVKAVNGKITVILSSYERYTNNIVKKLVNYDTAVSFLNALGVARKENKLNTPDFLLDWCVRFAESGDEKYSPDSIKKEVMKSSKNLTLNNSNIDTYSPINNKTKNNSNNLTYLATVSDCLRITKGEKLDLVSDLYELGTDENLLTFINAMSDNINTFSSAEISNVLRVLLKYGVELHMQLGVLGEAYNQLKNDYDSIKEELNALKDKQDIVSNSTTVIETGTKTTGSTHIFRSERFYTTLISLKEKHTVNGRFKYKAMYKELESNHSDLLLEDRILACRGKYLSIKPPFLPENYESNYILSNASICNYIELYNNTSPEYRNNVRLRFKATDLSSIKLDF